MPSIRMIVERAGLPRRGEVLNVSDERASRWVEQGLAVLAAEPAKAEPADDTPDAPPVKRKRGRPRKVQ